jgi:hypothetical protein
MAAKIVIFALVAFVAIQVGINVYCVEIIVVFVCGR